MTDIVNHPPHYTSCPSGVECLDITELLPFCLGNAYKYLHRAGLKGDKLTDLQKAYFYAKRAYINGEQLTDLAESRIQAVAHYRRLDAGRTGLMDAFLHFGTIYNPQLFLTRLELAIKDDLDNRSA